MYCPVAARDATVAAGGPSWTVKLGRRDSTTASRNIDLPSPFANLDTLISSFATKGLNTKRHALEDRKCPKDTGNGNLAPLDLVTPNSFDNNYYKNLLQKKGLLQSDQVLFSGGATDSIVSEYARSSRAFQEDFASAMIKMSEIQAAHGVKMGSLEKSAVL
ncbi:PREDICTED: lignin-forming anionic peroxidase-like [Ipomoea nil]|uniref:lignin-forming anionic peroxidase-like n=1 Tax=Ipomoea nil TaxID=35883 RepID=UPI000901E263|nr:PREDICTED: lignin-forming anionic peroxidase-like [Ipomoea nil]